MFNLRQIINHNKGIWDPGHTPDPRPVLTISLYRFISYSWAQIDPGLPTNNLAYNRHNNSIPTDKEHDVSFDSSYPYMLPQ
jgi:hypothetical protein